MNELALNGETYVVSVNEFSAICSWQVVGVLQLTHWINTSPKITITMYEQLC